MKPYPGLFILILLFFPSLNLRADSIIQLNPERDKYTPECYVLEDKSGKLTFEDVLRSKKFVPAATNSFGFTSSVIWIRFQYRVPEKTSEEWYLEIGYPQLDRVHHFQVIKDRILHQMTGDTLPFNERDVRHHNFLMKLDGAPGVHTSFLKVETESSMTIPVSLITGKYIIEELNIQKTVFGIFYGILIIMGLYNLFLSISMKDSTYVWYVGFIISMMLVSLVLNGYGFQYLWPGVTWLNRVAPFSVFLVLITMTIFSYLFLDIKKYFSGSAWLFKAISIYGIIGLVISWIVPYRIMMMVSASSLLPPIVLILLIAIRGLLKGSRQSFYYIIAFTSLFTGAILTVLHRFGVFSASNITLWGFQIGCSMSIALLSLGLADRVNSLKNNLALLNASLEDRVVERTRDLADAHATIKRDMNLASSVQTKMLPQSVPESSLYDIALLFNPASDVSGDFFDFYRNRHMLSGAGLFDVSGHGLSSGLITLMARSIITRNFEKNPDESLSRIMEIINHELVQEMQNIDHYITGVLLRFKGDRIDYVNCGHPDILFRREKTGKTGRIVDKNGESICGPFLGLKMMEGEYRQVSFRLDSGDALVLYSDCLLEGCNEKEEPFDHSGLTDALRSAPGGTAEDILNHIIERFTAHAGSKDELKDDLTVLVLKKK